MSGWRSHPVVERVKPYVRTLRDRPGRAIAAAQRVRRRWARARHHSIPIVDLRPADVRQANRQLVLSRLEKAGVPVVVVRGKRPTLTYVAVGAEHREAAARALARGNSAPHLRVQLLASDEVDGMPVVERSRPLASLADGKLADDTVVLRVFAWHDTTPDTLVFGPKYACDVEFWTSLKNDWYVAPRANGFASQLAPDLFQPVPVEIDGHVLPVARGVHERYTLDDVTFPIDAVYVWRGDDTFDALRYSLRSLDMFAPWIRRVHIVTDQPLPAFLVPDDRLVIVGHDHIADRPDRLPTGNTEAISTWLHRIDGISDHFVYVTDGVFFGRDVQPDTFFTGAGQMRVFPLAAMRPFGPVTPVDDIAHIKAKQVADLVEERYGRRPTRVVRHAPVALTTAILRAIESEFADAVEITRQQRQPAAEGIPIELMAHHVSQIVGGGVPSEISSDYFDVSTDIGLAGLRELVTSRRRDVFRVHPGEAATADASSVRQMLERLFPIASRWER